MRLIPVDDSTYTRVRAGNQGDDGQHGQTDILHQHPVAWPPADFSVGDGLDDRGHQEAQHGEEDGAHQPDQVLQIINSHADHRC